MGSDRRSGGLLERHGGVDLPGNGRELSPQPAAMPLAAAGTDRSIHQWRSMVSRLLSLALRSLRVRFSRTMLTALGVVLGVAVIMAVQITNLSALESITTLFSEASGKADLVVISASSDSQGFADDVLRPITSAPGVESAVPSLHLRVRLADEPAPSQLDLSLFGTVAGGLMVYGIDPELDSQAREYKIAAGQFLSPDPDAYDIVLVKDYAQLNEIEVGHDVRIVTPAGIELLRVVGLLSKEGAGQLNNGAFGILPLLVAQEMFERSGELDQVDILASPQVAGTAGLDQLKAALQERLGADYTVMYPATQGRRVTQMLQGYQLGLSFVSVIAIFVGAFLIYNAFWMTVAERTREIGMLRTVGMTRRQVMRQILTEAGILGVVGSVLGIGFGILLSRGLIRLMELLLAQEVKQVPVPLQGLATSLLVGLGVTLAAASIPAWQAGRISPLEALRIRGDPRESWIIRRGWVLGVTLLAFSYLVLYQVQLPGDVSWMGHAFIFVLLLAGTLLVPIAVRIWERTARPWFRRVYGNEGQLGSRNAQRAKLRTTLTVAALLVGVAMILSTSAIVAAFTTDISAWMENYIGGDLYIYSTVPMRADLAWRLEAVEGVDAATPTRYLDVRRLKPDGGDERLTFTAVDPFSYERVASFAFATGQGDRDQLLNRLAAGDAVFISSVLSEKYALTQGDTIRLSTRRGSQDFEVAAVVVDFYNRGFVVQGSWKDLRRYFGLNDVSAFLVKLQPGYSTEEVRERIDHLYGERRHLTLESNQALKGRALNLLAQTSSLFDVLALIAIVVAALGVVNTLTMNVLERRQEIGMLRSVGMTRRQVGKMILAEAGMMGLVGGSVGLVFGLFLSHAVLSTINSMMGYELTYTLPVQGIMVSLVIALIVSQLAALWPARHAAKMRIIEAIQFE
jgi:putative ABC transport system permease protein